jgi:hypothetical protein
MIKPVTPAHAVVPAKAGTQAWAPAFAGVTASRTLD